MKQSLRKKRRKLSRWDVYRGEATAATTADDRPSNASLSRQYRNLGEDDMEKLDETVGHATAARTAGRARPLGGQRRGRDELATVVAVPFKTVDSAKDRTGMKGNGRKETKRCNGEGNGHEVGKR